jgi:CRISPR/Cas system-associated endonuclease Cas1
MLNYAYAALESQARVAIASHGLDPRLGVLHAAQGGRDALVYDLMEPLRPRVDALVIAFLREHTMTPSDFVVTPMGVCRLHPQLARRVTHLAPPFEVGQEQVRKVAIQLGNGRTSVARRTRTESGVVHSGRPSRHKVRRA